MSDATATVSLPALAEVRAAAARIRGAVRRTPLERSAGLSERCGTDVHLKLECWQRTRSFKVRGAANAIVQLDAAARARGLVTASAGNHGLAVALAAYAAGLAVTVFVPATAPDAKKRRIRALGATLDERAPTYDAAEVEARGFAQRTGATLVHAFSDPAVVAGAATIGLEILEDLPGVRTVIVPVGGGGLIAGVGAVLKAVDPSIRVIGVQSTETRVMYESLHAGRVVDLPVTPTLADGLAGCIDADSLARVQRTVDALHLVEESALPEAVRDLYEQDGVVAEGSSATAVAALALPELPRAGPIALVITGGNIDGVRLAACLGGTWR